MNRKQEASGRIKMRIQSLVGLGIVLYVTVRRETVNVDFVI